MSAQDKIKQSADEAAEGQKKMEIEHKKKLESE